MPTPRRHSDLAEIGAAAAAGCAAFYGLAMAGAWVVFVGEFWDDPLRAAATVVALAVGGATLGAMGGIVLAAVLAPVAALAGVTLRLRPPYVGAGAALGGVVVCLSVAPWTALLEPATPWEARRMAVLVVAAAFLGQLVGVYGRPLATRRAWVRSSRRAGVSPRFTMAQLLVATACLAPLLTLVRHAWSGDQIGPWAVMVLLAQPLTAWVALRVALAWPLAREHAWRHLSATAHGAALIVMLTSQLVATTRWWLVRRAAERWRALPTRST